MDAAVSMSRAVSEEAGRNENLITLTADIVAAHVTNNKVEVGDIPRLIGSVYDALASVGQPGKPEQQAPVPAVSIRASIKPDYIVCLEDGRSEEHTSELKSLMRISYAVFCLKQKKTI